MDTPRPDLRVEVRFVGTPPTGQIARASGVTEVDVDGATVRCRVAGSVQSFLEALSGHEVIALQSTPVEQPVSSSRAVGEM